MFEIDRTVLVLIDVQGRLARMMHGKEELFASLETMLKGMEILGVPVVWMEQLPDKLGPTTPSIAALLPGESPIPKDSFSCLGNPGFVDRFRNINRDQVLLTGIESHICVYQTGMDLLQRGFEVQVVTDCVSSRTLENKILGIERIKLAGGSATSCEMILFELMKAARGETFKRMVKIIK
ncbi:MAG: isochorismatase family protein [Desulfobacteraceae bacterium]|nr:isochorismatase family protein [Desulfobacteraceae bacterium]